MIKVGFSPKEAMAEAVHNVVKNFLVMRSGIDEQTADLVGASIGGAVKGISIEKRKPIYQDIEVALNNAWVDILSDISYDELSEECIKELKQKVVTAGTVLDIINAPQPENVLRNRIIRILKKYIRWDGNKLNVASRHISSILLNAINSVINTNEILALLTKIDALLKEQNTISGKIEGLETLIKEVPQLCSRFAKTIETMALLQLQLNSPELLESKGVPLEAQALVSDSIDQIIDNENKQTEIILKSIEDLRKDTKKSFAEYKPVKAYPDLITALVAKGGKRTSDGGIYFNLNMLDLDILSNSNEKDIQFMRGQLGNRLSGKENRNEIITLFWAETKMAFQSQRRHGVMPMFQQVVRDTCMASIYVDKFPRIIDHVHLTYFYWENYDVYHLQGERYIIRILEYDKEPIAISMSYDFSDLSDVNDRLFCFEKINPIINAKTIQILGRRIDNYNIIFETRGLGPEWTQHVEITYFWYEQMKRIQEIESHHNVHFNLPSKATEEEYISIEILSDSIHRKCCRILPGIGEGVFENKGLGDIYSFDEEMSLGCSKCLRNIYLFGHTFIPIEEYVIPCDLYWNKDSNCYETKEGGIPIGVDFRIAE